jgi:hypothetical protein
LANLIQSGSYALARAEAYQTTSIYAIKMAGVFMMATCTISLKTQILPRWMVFRGYALALILLLSVGIIEWILVVFPLWVLLISSYILIETFAGQNKRSAEFRFSGTLRLLPWNCQAPTIDVLRDGRGHASPRCLPGNREGMRMTALEE